MRQICIMKCLKKEILFLLALLEQSAQVDAIKSFFCFGSKDNKDFQESLLADSQSTDAAEYTDADAAGYQAVDTKKGQDVWTGVIHNKYYIFNQLQVHK